MRLFLRVSNDNPHDRNYIPSGLLKRCGIARCNIHQLKLCSYTRPVRICLFVPCLSPYYSFHYLTDKERFPMNHENHQRALAEAADADAVGSDTSFTICPATFLPVLRAMSASATMPEMEPRSSTTGTRLIRFSSMSLQHSSSDMSAVTVTIGLLMQSAAVSSTGLSPLAIVRQTMSRSVTTPMGTLLELLSITGISPQSWSTIIRATSGREVSAVQHAGSVVIISLTCIALTPSSRIHIPQIFK